MAFFNLQNNRDTIERCQADRSDQEMRTHRPTGARDLLLVTRESQQARIDSEPVFTVPMLPQMCESGFRVKHSLRLVGRPRRSSLP